MPRRAELMVKVLVFVWILWCPFSRLGAKLITISEAIHVAFSYQGSGIIFNKLISLQMHLVGNQQPGALELAITESKGSKRGSL